MKYLLLSLLVIVLPFQTLYSQCEEDCVWPGDLNANGVANSLDILAIGLAVGETGPARANQSVLWEPLESEDWAGMLPILGTNFKHIDADGNGVIDTPDQIPISLNYDQKNDNFVGLLGSEIPGNDLFIIPDNTVASPGSSLFFDIHLGTVDNPINDLYGIGFQIIVDTQYVANAFFDFSENWIGVPDEVLSYGKYSEEFDNMGVGITRLDGNTNSGFGRIARLEIVITDVILGLELDSTACIPFPVEFKNVLGIDQEEGDLMITSHGDSLELKHPSQLNSSIEINKETNLKIYPNPVRDRIFIESEDHPIHEIVLFNQIGQLISRQSYQTTPEKPNHFSFSMKGHPNGIYFIEVLTKNQKTTQKILYAQ